MYIKKIIKYWESEKLEFKENEIVTTKMSLKMSPKCHQKIKNIVILKDLDVYKEFDLIIDDGGK